MNERNWEAELKKIDRAIESVPDQALAPAKTAKSSPLRPVASDGAPPTTTLGVLFRLSLSLALAVALAFWPYSARCGLGMAAYLGAVVTLAGASVWSAIWTWRHRAPKGHFLSLLALGWALTLGAIDVLPRIGYAKPTLDHPARWACGP